MKLKNVKVGTRVKLKEDLYYLKKSMMGTIIVNDVEVPHISWDNHTEGHNGFEHLPNLIKLGLPENSVWAVHIERLKRVKE